jgi:hypothetical protein
MQLSTQILHILGKEGPVTANRGKYIRYIYNCLLLESAIVRAAAVSSLARVAGSGSTPELRRSVAIMLQQSLVDSDDELRDRATYVPSVFELDELAGEISEIESLGYSAINAVMGTGTDDASVPDPKPLPAAPGIKFVPKQRIEAATKLLSLPCP